MDRDQRSRKQKADGRATQMPRRSLGSRVGLQKQNSKAQPQSRPARGPASASGVRRPAQTQQGSTRRASSSNSGAARPADPPKKRSPVQNNPQKPGYRSGSPRPQRRVTQAEMVRRRNRRRILGALAVFAVLVVGVILSVNLLFKVTAFRVENLDGSTPANIGPYTEEQILQCLGVQEGDNLFGFSTNAKSEELSAALPYLDEVTVGINMPGTVVIKVRAAVERFIVQYGNAWLVVSESGKILRIETEQPGGLIWLEVNLPAGMDATPGRFLRMDSDGSATTATGETAVSATQTTLAALLDGLREEGLLEGVSIISLVDPGELNFLYEGRVSVKLGTANNLSYKLRLAAATILDTDGKGLAATDRGTLDVSYQRSDGEIWAYFQSADPIQDEPVPEDGADPTAGSDAPFE